ncbi:MAG: magnesium and cobalt transport protein CorA [Desertimonas sp.]
MIVDCGIYTDGGRRAGPVDPADALAEARDIDGWVWLVLRAPERSELDAVATSFGLHPLAVEDAVHPHQRPKLERYGDSLFLVLKPARSADLDEGVELGQIMVFVGDRFVVSVWHGAARELSDVCDRVTEAVATRPCGVADVLHAIADQVVDDYETVMRGLDHDIDQIEHAVFADPRRRHAERIFRLKREVLDFRRAVEPLEGPMEQLAVGDELLDARSRPYFRDVHDHSLRVADRLHAVDALLDSALQANVAQVGMQQNEDMRKISAWAAILAVPTMIAGIYGMNFEHMPELRWLSGYPLALVLMVLCCIGLHRVFKRRGWL